MKIAIKSLSRLFDKKVEIVAKPIGVAAERTYQGIFTSVYSDGNEHFIELDNKILINSLYIATITILD